MAQNPYFLKIRLKKVKIEGLLNWSLEMAKNFIICSPGHALRTGIFRLAVKILVFMLRPLKVRVFDPKKAKKSLFFRPYPL